MAPRNQTLEVLQTLSRNNPDTKVDLYHRFSELRCEGQQLYVRAEILDLLNKYIVLASTPGSRIPGAKVPDEIQTNFYPILLDDQEQPYRFQSVKLENTEAIVTGNPISYIPPDRIIESVTENDTQDELLTSDN